MNCDKYIELMSAALDGECTAEERSMLDEHLAVCPRCADLFRLLADNVNAARQLNCEVPADLKSRIMSSLPQQDAPAKAGKVIRWKRWIPVAAAACLILAVSLTLPHGLSMETNDAAPGFDRTADSAESYNGTAYDSSYGVSLNPGSAAAGAGYELNDSVYDACSNQQAIRVHYGATPAPGALIVGSTGELAAYLAQFDSLAWDEEGSTIPIRELEALALTYGEEFFVTGRLLMVLVEAPSGSNRYEIVPQGLLRDTVTVKETVPEVGTADMAAWLLVAEVGAMFDGGDTLEVVIIN